MAIEACHTCTAQNHDQTNFSRPMVDDLTVAIFRYVVMSLQQQKRAKDELKTAERIGVGVDELTASIFGGRYAHRTWPTRYSSRRSTSVQQSVWDSAQSQDDTRSPRNNGFESDEDDGVDVIVSNRRRTRQDPVEECRKISTSAWLHFPRIELAFLLFAFEGFVASQLSAIRKTECTWVLCTAVTILVRAAIGRKYKPHGGNSPRGASLFIR